MPASLGEEQRLPTTLTERLRELFDLKIPKGW
jgi:hypothetical protein